MNLKIIDEDFRLVDIDEVPENYAPISNVVFFYLPSKDWIVFNVKNPDHDIYLYIVKTYLEFDDMQRKELYKSLECVAKTALPCIRTLNNILRIRRRIYK